MTKINKILVLVSTALVIMLTGCGGGESSSGSTTNITASGAFPYYWAKTLYGYEIEFTVTESTGAAVDPGFQVIYTFDGFGSVLGYNTKNNNYYYPDNYTSTQITDSYDIDIRLSYYGGSAIENYSLSPKTATTGTYTYDADNSGTTGTAKGTYRILVDGGGNTGYIDPAPLANGIWTAPVLMDTNGSHPLVANTDSGALAVWRKYEENGTVSMITNSYSSTSGWSDTTVIGNNVGYHTVVANHTGAITHLAWIEPGKISTKTFIADQWSTSSTIATLSADLISLHEPVLKTNDNGDAVLVWGEYTSASNTTHLFCAIYSHGLGWGAVRELASSIGDATYDVDIDENRNVMVVWGVWSYYYDVVSMIWTPRTTMGQLSSSAAVLAANPQVSMDANGNAIAVWISASDSFSRKLMSNRFTVGSGWGAEVELSSPNTNCDEPDIAIDSQGNAIVVWRQREDVDLNNAYAIRYTFGSGWDTPALIETDNTASLEYSPQIVFDGNNNAIVLWQSLQYLWVNHYIADEGWKTPRRIASVRDEDIIANPAVISYGQNGDATVSWNQRRDGVYSVYSIRFE
ncbi:MAG: hypothetical protein WBF77_06465 [Sulfurimonadaceae bacterium]